MDRSFSQQSVGFWDVALAQQLSLASIDGASDLSIASTVAR